MALENEKEYVNFYLILNNKERMKLGAILQGGDKDFFFGQTALWQELAGLCESGEELTIRITCDRNKAERRRLSRDLL